MFAVATVFTLPILAAATPTWQANIDIEKTPYLTDHKVGEKIYFPKRMKLTLLYPCDSSQASLPLAQPSCEHLFRAVGGRLWTQKRPHRLNTEKAFLLYDFFHDIPVPRDFLSSFHKTCIGTWDPRAFFHAL